jgi:ribosomal protein S18 acetylase RimI-like enzyme
MNPAIAPFAAADYEQVFALWKRCEGVGLSDADGRDAIWAYLEKNPGLSFAARAGGEIVGAILGGHDGRRGYIYHLAVDAGWRRKGIARLLVERCLAALKESGIQKVHIFIFSDNLSGKAFWESMGWTCRGDIGVVSKSL